MYLDRTCIGLVAPTIMKEFHLDKVTRLERFGFQRGVCDVSDPGRMAGRPVRSTHRTRGRTCMVVYLHRCHGSVIQRASLAATRFLFGAGEAAAFPASSRAIARWLPVEQRAFGQGFQHSGSRLGAALAPAIVVSLVVLWSWRSVFFIFGAGVACAILVSSLPRLSRAAFGVNAAELKS